jgi:hypothetical protein
MAFAAEQPLLGCFLSVEESSGRVLGIKNEEPHPVVEARFEKRCGILDSLEKRSARSSLPEPDAVFFGNGDFHRTSLRITFILPAGESFLPPQEPACPEAVSRRNRKTDDRESMRNFPGPHHDGPMENQPEEMENPHEEKNPP